MTVEAIQGGSVTEQALQRPSSSRRAAPNSPTRGVYDPIKNEWIVEPQDKRIVEGLSYHPRGLFQSYGRTGK